MSNSIETVRTVWGRFSLSDFFMHFLPGVMALSAIWVYIQHRLCNETIYIFRLDLTWQSIIVVLIISYLIGVIVSILGGIAELIITKIKGEWRDSIPDNNLEGLMRDKISRIFSDYNFPKDKWGRYLYFIIRSYIRQKISKPLEADRLLYTVQFMRSSIIVVVLWGYVGAVCWSTWFSIIAALIIIASLVYGMRIGRKFEVSDVYHVFLSLKEP